MSWRHRVMRKLDPTDPDDPDFDDYGIVEYYTNPEGWTVNFVEPIGNSLPGLRDELLRMLEAVDAAIDGRDTVIEGGVYEYNSGGVDTE